MMLRFSQSARFIAVVAVAIGLFSVSAQADRPLSKSKFDPKAKQVDMFPAMESEEIAVKPIAKDEFGGNLLITNNTEEPITVKVPQGFVVAPLAQFGGGFGQQGGGLGGGQQGGGQQAAGGGAQQGGLQGGGQQGGQSFFSIPPKKTLRVPYISVCLEHGKASPHPRSDYVVIPSEKFTQDPALITLIDMIATGKIDKASAQAAAWHLSNQMSWQELAAKKYDRLGVPDTPYFSYQQLAAAEQVVATARQLAEEGGLQKPVAPPTSDRVRASR